MFIKAKKALLLAIALPFSLQLKAQSAYQMQQVPIQTRWAKDVSPDNALKEYPRPQMARTGWTNLNGLWDYTITAKDADAPQKPEGKILVPYPIESALSGVKKQLKPTEALWYTRKFDLPKHNTGDRILLHFGAADYQATVFVNGKLAGEHTGGYTAFEFDITPYLRAGENTLTVKILDPSDQGNGPHGKQVLSPQSIYYTPSSGIWQTVWLEAVPEAYIQKLTITPDIDKSLVNITVHAGTKSNNSNNNQTVQLKVNGRTYTGTANQNIAVPIAHPRLWSPAHPNLYEFTASLNGDQVKSYFGMRKISVGKNSDGNDLIFLNNKPYYNLGTLDQGFWPEGLYTAPTDEALAFDIKAIKAMGFNTIRKHIKVEPARWYYYADKLGMLVWQDMVNPNQGLPTGAKEAFEQQSKEEIEQLHNYPSITTWVLFNERWGQYDQARLTKWLKEADPSRIVNGHTGELLYVDEQLRAPSVNPYVNSDITDVHAYPDPMNSLKLPGKARVCGEFGGIGVFIPDHQWISGSAWGYVTEKPAGLAGKYTIMNQHLKLMEKDGLSGSIYTQPFDVEGEQNGLMTYDREIIKIPFAKLREIHKALNPELKETFIPKVSAKDADLTEPAVQYSILLQQYIEGNRNKEFLRRLGMLAAQAGDKPGVRLASAAYIKTLKSPYSKEDLEYVMQVTSSTTDPGFPIIYQNAAQIDLFLGTRQAEVKMMNLIYKDKIQPKISRQNAQPDWTRLNNDIQQFGASGEEILLRAKALHYLNKQDYQNFVPAADAYISRFGAFIRPEELNQFAWAVFEKSNDQQQLLTAAEWSKLSARDNSDPNLLDTRANLLYKAGRKTEAIVLQEKAVSLSQDAALKATLDKMKAGK